jgi:16S rRNA processing protein RimM
VSDRPASPAASPSFEWLAFGVIGRAHGVRGEAVLHPYNEGGIALGDLDLPLRVLLERQGRREPGVLTQARPAGAGYLVRFEGIDAREQVPRVTNAVLLLPRDSLPPLEEGEYYVEDLIGCAAVDRAGRALGTVRGTYWNGAHDVLSIVDEAGAETLLPAVPDFLLEVDLEGRRLTVDPHEADDDGAAPADPAPDEEPEGSPGHE